MTKVLYLGMSQDVLLPLNLVPDCDTIFVIDLVQYGFSRRRTQTSICADIARILSRGRYDNWDYKLETGTRIALHAESRVGNRWQLDFDVDGQAKTLVRYEGDFFNEWPADVCDITHFMAPGAFSVEFLRDNATFRQMFLTRLAPTCALFFDCLPWTGLSVPDRLLRNITQTTYTKEALCVAAVDTRHADWIETTFSQATFT